MRKLGFIRLLLKQGDINSTILDKQGLTLLTHAAKARREGIVEMLLGRGHVNSDSLNSDSETRISYPTISLLGGKVI